MAELIFLGTGASTGIPILSCTCEVCNSTDSYNKRLRSSVLIHSGKTNIVIDSTPDFRSQCLRENLQRIDAIFLTHSHSDHIFGLEDVRLFTQSDLDKKTIPIYCDYRTLSEVKKIFYHACENNYVGGLPMLNLKEVGIETYVNDLCVKTIELIHGQFYCTGYIIGNLAYLVDVSNISSESMNKLRGIDILVIDATRFDSHPNHLSVSHAIDISRELNTKKTYITHIDHTVLHSRDSKRLPKGISFAYDGLKIKFSKLSND